MGKATEYEPSAKEPNFTVVLGATEEIFFAGAQIVLRDLAPLVDKLGPVQQKHLERLIFVQLI